MMDDQRCLRVCLLLLIGGWLSACDSLLHEDYTLLPVPERVLGAQPYYAGLPQPSPRLVPVPDTLEAQGAVWGLWLLHVVPHQGVAVWRRSGTDTLAEAFLELPGLLDVRPRSDTLLECGRASDTYALRLTGTSLRVDSVPVRTWLLDPYRYLPSLLQPGSTPRARPGVHVECPDSSRTLAGFRLAPLEAPACYFE